MGRQEVTLIFSHSDLSRFPFPVFRFTESASCGRTPVRWQLQQDRNNPGKSLQEWTIASSDSDERVPTWRIA